MIRFSEERQILDGSIVKAGDIKAFTPEEEAAYIANGVAGAVNDKKTEVTTNG